MSLNGYSYVEGNPTNWTDPSGNQPEIGAACAAFLLADGPFPFGDLACLALITIAGVAAIAGVSNAVQNAASSNFSGFDARIIASFCNRGSCSAADLLQPTPFDPNTGFPLVTPTPFNASGGYTLITPEAGSQFNTPLEATPVPVETPIGFPIPTQPPPGSNILQSIQVPGPGEWRGFQNRNLGNPPRGTSYEIYEYRQKNGLYYVGSATLRNLFDRLTDHVQQKTDRHPLGSLNEAIWTELTAERGTILIAEQIRIAQLIVQGIPLANDGNSANARRIRAFWERGGHNNTPDWPAWLYPPSSLLE